MLKVILFISIIGHILCGISDCLLSYSPSGRIDLKGAIKDPEKMRTAFRDLPLKWPLISIILGVYSITAFGFGYLELSKWMGEFSKTASTVMYVSVVIFLISIVVHHIICGLVEWLYVRLGRTDEEREAALEFQKKTIVTMIVGYLGLATFLVTLFIMIVTGKTTLPQWACAFNTLPIMLVLAPTKLPAKGNIAGAVTNGDGTNVATFAQSGGTIAGAVNNKAKSNYTISNVNARITNNVTNAGTFTLTNGTITGTVTNSGTFNQTTGSIGNTINNTGTFTQTNGYNGGAVNNTGTGKYEIKAGNIAGAVTNGDGTNVATFTQSGGTIAGAVNNKAKSNYTISNANARITGAVTNAGTFTLTNGTLTNTVTNSGTFTQTTGSIAGAITTSGTYTQSNGYNASTVSNTGTYKLNGGRVNGKITNGGSLTIAGGTSSGGFANNAGKTITFSSGSVGAASTNNGTLNISGGANTQLNSTLTNNSGGTVNQSGGTITGIVTNNAGGTYNLTTGTAYIKNNVTNAGTFKLTNGTITGTVTNSGTFTQTTGLVGAVTNTGTGKYALNGGNISGNVINGDGTNNATFTQGAGTVTGTVTNKTKSTYELNNANARIVSMGTNQTGGTFKLTNGTIAGGINNSGSYISNGGVTDGTITNQTSGTILATAGKMTGPITNAGKITTGANLFTGTITNNKGTLILTGNNTALGGNINNYNGTTGGTVYIGDGGTQATIINSGTKAISAGSLFIQHANSELKTDVNKLDIISGTITNNGTLTLTGSAGTLQEALAGNGKVIIDSNVTAQQNITNAITINANKTLNIDVDHVGNNITTNGTALFVTNDGTTANILAKTVTGNGLSLIDGKVNLSAVIDTKGGAATISYGTGYGIKISTGTSYLNTNANNIRTNIDNQTGGTILLSGGALNYDIKGKSGWQNTGSDVGTIITGNVTINNAIHDKIGVNRGGVLTISANNINTEIIGNNGSGSTGVSNVILGSGSLNYTITAGSVTVAENQIVTLGTSGALKNTDVSIMTGATLYTNATADNDLAHDIALWGTLDLRDNDNLSYKISGNFTGHEGTINFDFINKEDNDHKMDKGHRSESGTDEGYLDYTEHDIITIGEGGKVSGHIKLGSINMTSAIYMYQNGDVIYAVNREEHPYNWESGTEDTTQYMFTTIHGGTISGNSVTNGTTAEGKIYSGAITEGTVGQISGYGIQEGDLEINRIVLFGDENGNPAQVDGTLIIDKTVTKYGSFAYTFEQLRPNSPIIAITAEPSELTLIEVINGRSMAGVNQAGQYVFDWNEGETPAVMSKQTKMAVQGATFNTYSFDQDTTMAKPFETYKALYNAAVGTGKAFTSYSQAALSLAGKTPEQISAAMTAMQNGTANDTEKAIVYASMLVKTKTTLDAVLKDIDPNYTLMQDYVVYNGDGSKTDTLRWEGNQADLTTGYFAGLTDGTIHIDVIKALEEYDKRIENEGLGTLTPSQAGGSARQSRVLTLNGNGMRLEGGETVNNMLAASQGITDPQNGFKGVKLTQPKDELHIVNVKSVSGFDGYVVDNQGQVFLADTQATAENPLGLALQANVIDSTKTGNTGGRGSTTITNSTLTIAPDYKIDQSYVEIDNQSTVNTRVDGLIVSGVTNNTGTINMYGGNAADDTTAQTLMTSVMGKTGILHIMASTGGTGSNIKVEGETVIADTVLVDNGSKLTIGASNITGGEIINRGTLALGEGVLGYGITEGTVTPHTGKTIITGNIYAGDNGKFIQKGMEIQTGNILNIRADNLNTDEAVENSGTLRLNGNETEFNSGVIGSGTTVIDGSITGKKSISQQIVVKDLLDTLTIDADLLGNWDGITSTVENNGTIILTGNGTDEDASANPDSKDTLQKEITGGDLIINSPANAITSDVQNLHSNKITNQASTLILLGGSEDTEDGRDGLATSIYGTGHTQIGKAGKQAYLELADGIKIQNNIDIYEGSALSINAADILREVNNDGTLHLKTGELAVNVDSLTNGTDGGSYKGKTVIDGDVVARSSRRINQGGMEITTAGHLTVNADTLNILSAADAYTPIFNSGDLTLTGGSLHNALLNVGTGEDTTVGSLHIENGNVAIMDNPTAATPVTQIFNDIYISKDSTLTMNAINLQGVVKDNKGTLVVDVAENLYSMLQPAQQAAVDAFKGGLPAVAPIYGTGKVVIKNKTVDNPATTDKNEQLIFIDIAPFEAGEAVIEQGGMAAIPNLIQIGEKGITNNGKLVLIGLTEDEANGYLEQAGAMGMTLPYTVGDQEFNKAIGAGTNNALGIENLQTVSTKITSSLTGGSNGELVIGMGKNSTKVFIDGDLTKQNITVAGGILYIDPDTLHGKDTGYAYDASMTLVPENIDINTGEMITDSAKFNDTSTIVVPKGRGGTFNQMVAGMGKVEIDAPVNMGDGSGFVPLVYMNLDQMASGAPTEGSGIYTVGVYGGDDPDTKVINTQNSAENDLNTVQAFISAGSTDPSALTSRQQTIYGAYQNIATAKAAYDIAKSELETAERMGLNTLDHSRYLTAKSNYVSTYQAWRNAVETYSAFQAIPVSGISVELNDTFAIGNSENLKGGGLQSLTIGSNGHLNLINDDCGTLVIGNGNMASAALTAVPGSRLSLDIESDMQMDNIVVLGKAEGTLSLATLNVKDEIMPEYKLGDGEEQVAVRWVKLTVLDDSGFDIIGTTTAYGDYIYTISYEKESVTDSNKKLKIVKEWGFTLPQIIQAAKDGAYKIAAAKISTYSFNEDAVNTNHTLVKGGDLGTFRREEYKVIGNGIIPNAGQITLDDARNYAQSRVEVGDTVKYNGREYTVVADDAVPEANQKKLSEAKTIVRNNVIVGGDFTKDREFSINGNKTTLNGGGFKGMKIENKKDTLNITDISKLDNFENGLLGENKGTLNIKGTNTTSMAAAVKGDGTLNIKTDVVLENIGYTTTRVTDLKGQEFRKNNKGLYVDSQNNVLDDQSIENVRVQGVLERCDKTNTYKTNAEGIYIYEDGTPLESQEKEYVEDHGVIIKQSPIPGWYVGNIFYSLQEAVENAVINYKRTGSTTYNVADGITVTFNTPVIEQDTLNIESGSLTADAGRLKIKNAITADGNLRLTGGTLGNNVSGKGVVEIDGDTVGGGTTVTAGHVTLNGRIGNKITVYENNTLTMNATNIGDTVTNDGNLELTGGTLGKLVTFAENENSVITMTGDISSDASYLGSKVELAADKTLTLTDGNITCGINGDSGSKLVIDSGNASGSKIRNDAQVTGIASLKIAAQNTFTTGAEDLQLADNGKIENKGTFNYAGSGDTLEIANDITDGKTHTDALDDLEGTVNLSGNMALNDSNKITQKTINIITGDSVLNVLADNVSADTINNGGKFIIRGENVTIRHTEIKDYTDETGSLTSGTTIIDGTITSLKNIGNKIVINQDKKLIIGANLVGGDVTDNGTLVLVGGTDAENLSVLAHKVEHDGIGGHGNVQIGTGDMAAYVLNENGNQMTIDGLDILSGSVFTLGLADLTLANGVSISNDGTLNLSGGTLTNSINGNGTTHVARNTKISSDVGNALVVDAGITANIKPEYIQKGITLASDYTGYLGKETLPAGTYFKSEEHPDGVEFGTVSVSNIATVVVDRPGDFVSAVSGVGTVDIEADVSMGEGSSFDINYAVDLAKKSVGMYSNISYADYIRKISEYIINYETNDATKGQYLERKNYYAGVVAAATGLSVNDPAVQAKAEEYFRQEMSLKYAETYKQIPMSSLDVKLNARLTVDSSSIAGGGINSLVMGPDGYLDFANGKAGTLVVGSFNAGNEGTSNLSLDVINDNSMDGFVVLGDAEGTLNLKTVNVMDELIKGKEIVKYTKDGATYYHGEGVNDDLWFNSNYEVVAKPEGAVAGDKYYGTISGGSVLTFLDKNGYQAADASERIAIDSIHTKSLVNWQDLPIYGNDSLSINGTKTAYGKYLYTFSYEYNREKADKMLKVVKDDGFSMREVIQGQVRNATAENSTVIRAADINTYSYTEDAYNVGVVRYVIGDTKDAAGNFNGEEAGINSVGGGNLGILTRDDNAGDYYAGGGEGNIGAVRTETGADPYGADNWGSWMDETTNAGKNITSANARTLYINGNNHAMNGMGWKGLVVNGGNVVDETDEIVLSNINKISNFRDGIVATNNGKLTIQTGNMDVKSGLAGTGLLNIVNANVTIDNNSGALASYENYLTDTGNTAYVAALYKAINSNFTKGVTRMDVALDADGKPMVDEITGEPVVNYYTYNDETNHLGSKLLVLTPGDTLKFYTPKLTQNKINIEKGSLTASGYALDVNEISNAGTLTITNNYNFDNFLADHSYHSDNVLKAKITNEAGKTIVAADDLTAEKSIANLITINAGKQLTTNAENILNKVTLLSNESVNGKLVLTSAEGETSQLGEAALLSGGEIYIGNADKISKVKMNGSQLDNNKLVAIGDGSRLILSTGTLVQAIGDNSHYTGTLEFASPVLAANDIWTNVEIGNEGVLTTTTDHLKNTDTEGIVTTVTNKGTVEITGGTAPLSKKIQGTMTGEEITGGTLIIGGDVTSVADNIASADNIVSEGKTLTLTGGDLIKGISGAGSVDIRTSDTVYAVTAGEGIGVGGNLTVTQGTLHILTGNIGQDIVSQDAAVVSLTAASSGTLEKVITGGTVTVDELAASEGTAVTVTADTANLKANAVYINKNNTLIISGTEALTTPVYAGIGANAGNNTTVIEENLESDVMIASTYITLKENVSLTIAAEHVGGKLTNKNTSLSDGDLGTVYLEEIAGGTNKLTNDIKVRDIAVIGNIAVDDAARLITSGSVNIAEGKTLTILGGIGNSRIDGAGDVIIDTNTGVTLNNEVGSDIIVNNGTLTINANHVQGNGTVNGIPGNNNVTIHIVGGETGTFDSTLTGTAGRLILDQDVIIGENSIFVPSYYVDITSHGAVMPPLTAGQQAQVGKTLLPMTNIDLDINKKLTNAQSTTALGKSGGFNNVTMGMQGNLDLRNGNQDTFVMGSLTAEYGSQISLDILNADSMDTFYVLGDAKGRLKVGAIDVQSDILTDVNETMINLGKNIILAPMPVLGTNKLFVQGTNVDFEQYRYTLKEVIIDSNGNVKSVDEITDSPDFAYDNYEGITLSSGTIDHNSLVIGDDLVKLAQTTRQEVRAFALVKEVGYNLHQVIQGFIRDNGEGRTEGRYSYGADALNYNFNGSDMVNTTALQDVSDKLAVGYGLGMLTRKVEIGDEDGYAMEDLNGYGTETEPAGGLDLHEKNNEGRTLTLNGNGGISADGKMYGRMFGGGTTGLEINAGDTVTIKNMPLVDDFEDGIVATNEGTFVIGEGKTPIQFNGRVVGNGTTNIGGKVILGDFYTNYTWEKVNETDPYDIVTSLNGRNYYLTMVASGGSTANTGIAQASIHVLQNGTLTSNANLLKVTDGNSIIVDGTLVLTGGTTQNVISSSEGTATGVVEIGVAGDGTASTAATTVEAKTEIKSANLVINKDAVLVATDSNGILSAGSIVNKGNLKALSDNIKSDIENSGTVDLQGGTLDADILGKGLVNIHGAFAKNDTNPEGAPVINAATIVLKKDGETGSTLVTDASTLKGNIKIEDLAVLTLNKGTLAGNVSGNEIDGGISGGTMVVSGGENAVGASGTITDILLKVAAGSTLNMEGSGLINTGADNEGLLTGNGKNFAASATVSNKEGGTLELKQGTLDTNVINENGATVKADNGAVVDAAITGGTVTGESDTANNFTVTNSKDTDRYTGNVVIYAGDGNSATDDKDNTLNISGKLGGTTKIYANDSNVAGTFNNTLHVTDSKTEVGFVGFVSGGTFMAFDNYVFDVDGKDEFNRENNAMLTLHQNYKFKAGANDIRINGTNLTEHGTYVLVDNSSGAGVEMLGLPTGLDKSRTYKSYNITSNDDQRIILVVEGINIENKNILGNTFNTDSAALITGGASGGTVGGTDEYVTVTAIDAAGYAKNNKIYVADSTGSGATGTNITGVHTIVYGDVTGARGQTEASKNEMLVYGTITGASGLDAKVTGAYSMSGKVQDNILTIKSAGTVEGGTLVGGETGTGLTSGNKVVVEGSVGKEGKDTNIFGARTTGGTLNNNGVVIGANEEPATLSGNTINVYGDNSTETGSFIDFADKTDLTELSVLNLEADKVTVKEGAAITGGDATINFNRGDIAIDGTISGGTVNLKDNTTMGDNGVLDGSELTLTYGKVLTVTDAAGLQTTSVDNYGTITLKNGTLSKDITGGTTKDDGTGSKVIIAGNVTLDNAKIGTVTEEGEIIGNNIIVNKNAVLATEDAANIAGTANNSGTINLTGGILASEIFGTGVTNINENVKSDVHNVGSKFVVAADKELILTGDNTYDDEHDNGNKVNFEKIKGTISGEGTTVIGDGEEANITTQGEISTAIRITENADLFAMGENVKNTVNIDEGGRLKLLGGMLDKQVSGNGIMTLGDLSVLKNATEPLSKPVTVTLGENGYVNTNVTIPKNGVIDFRAGKYNGIKPDGTNYDIDVKEGGTFVADIKDLFKINGEETVDVYGTEYPKYVVGDITVLGEIKNKNVGTYEMSLGRDYYLTEYSAMRNALITGSDNSNLELTITDGNLIIDPGSQVVQTWTNSAGTGNQQLVGGEYNDFNDRSGTVNAKNLRAAVVDTTTGDAVEIKSLPQTVLDVTPANYDSGSTPYVDELCITETKGTTVKALQVTGLKGRNRREIGGVETAYFTLKVSDSSNLTIVGDGKDLITSKLNDQEEHRIGVGQNKNNVDVSVEKNSTLKVGIYSESDNTKQGAKLQNINVDGGTFSAISSTVIAADINVKGHTEGEGEEMVTTAGNLIANGFADVSAETLNFTGGTAQVSIGELAKITVKEFNVTASSENATDGISLGEIITTVTKVESAKDGEGNIISGKEATLYVGNDAGSSKISTQTLEGDGVILLDPLYVNNIEEASHFAVNSTNITDTKIMVGRNSVLSLGTDDYKKSVELFNKLNRGFGTGTEANIKAAVYVDQPITLENTAKIYVDYTVTTQTKTEHQNNENYANSIYFGADTMLMVNAGNFILSNKTTVDAAIATGGNINVDPSSVLCLANVKPDNTYRILVTDGGTITGGWTHGNICGSNLLEFTIDQGDNYYNITVKKAIVPPDDPEPVPPEYKGHESIIEAIMKDPDSNAYKWLTTATNTGYYTEKQRHDNVAAMMNMAEAGGVMHGMATMADTFDDSIFGQIGLNLREGKKYKNAKIQNTVNEKVGAPSIDDINITKLPVAKTTEIMPQVPEYSEESPFIHEKRVWASYVHNKEKVNGMNLGDNFDGKYDMTVNGATIGADLWSGETSFGGISLMYSDGKINGSAGAATRNEVEYLGIGVYNRKDLENSISLMYDMTYINGENDIKQNNSGFEVTAKPKTKTISAGLRLEKMYDIKNCKLVPFAGLRYMNIDGDKYNNSIGLHYDAGKMNVFSLPLGIKIAGKEVTNSSGWGFKPYGELGYMFNFGDTDNNVEVSYGNGRDNVGYDVLDKGMFFAKLGFAVTNKNMVITLGYDYTKSSNAHNNKWNISANFTF